MSWKELVTSEGEAVAQLIYENKSIPMRPHPDLQNMKIAEGKIKEQEKFQYRRTKRGPEDDENVPREGTKLVKTGNMTDEKKKEAEKKLNDIFALKDDSDVSED